MSGGGGVLENIRKMVAIKNFEKVLRILSKNCKNWY